MPPDSHSMCLNVLYSANHKRGLALSCSQVDHATGTLDSHARIPWRATGIGTRACDPHPERFARSWEHPDTDLTFQPRISEHSRRMMAGGGGDGGGGQGFLERLASDNKRRVVKAKVGCCGCEYSCHVILFPGNFVVAVGGCTDYSYFAVLRITTDATSVLLIGQAVE